MEAQGDDEEPPRQRMRLNVNVADDVAGNNDVGDVDLRQSSDDETEGEDNNEQLKEEQQLAGGFVTEEAPARVEQDSMEQEEGSTCLICFEPWSNSGEHRVVCLRCGHIFGKSCIEKWLRGTGSRCPQCNSRARKKDIRTLFVKKLQALDTTERDRALQELQEEKEKRRLAEVRESRMVYLYQETREEVERLKKEMEVLRKSLGGAGNSGASTQNAAMARRTTLQFVKNIHLSAEGGCRVMAHNYWLNMIVVSQRNSSNLFSEYGVRQVNTLDLTPHALLPIHQKQIRDLAFNPEKQDLLLSVGMDRSAIITSISSNVQVDSFSCDTPLWSCCWSQTDPNHFFVGSQSSGIMLFDLRQRREALKYLVLDGDRSPVTALTYVPRSHKDAAHGLVVSSLNSLCFFSHEFLEPHCLPLEGPYTCVKYDSTCRKLLVSTRPNTRYSHARHLVSSLVPMEEGRWTCQVAKTLRGGTIDKVLSRSSFLTSPDRVSFVAANQDSTSTVQLWDVESGHCIQSVPCTDTVLDIWPVQVNSDCYVAMLSAKALRMYKWGS